MWFLRSMNNVVIWINAQLIKQSPSSYCMWDNMTIKALLIMLFQCWVSIQTTVDSEALRYCVSAKNPITFGAVMVFKIHGQRAVFISWKVDISLVYGSVSLFVAHPSRCGALTATGTRAGITHRSQPPRKITKTDAQTVGWVLTWVSDTSEDSVCGCESLMRPLTSARTGSA